MSYRALCEKWIAAEALSEAEREELRAVLDDEGELESRFYAPLEFGTAGLRGIMGAGINRMNLHVIRHVTQAFAQVILAEGEKAAARGVAICFDCRNHSEEFAREAACVMAGNGIPARLFDALRPTPELSFAVRRYGCIAGINVTASHNPKEYNGYKVYWEDGAQLPPKQAAAVAQTMEEIDLFSSIRRMDYEKAIEAGRITLIGEETDEAFLEQVLGQVNDRETIRQVADRFKVVYTPFHGCGHKLVPEALRRLGLKHVLCEPEQMVIDGNFPTVISPNPENPEGFLLAVRLAREHDVDFILGTDPDADRVGILVRNREGAYVPVTGNQTGVLLLDYLIGAKKRAGTLPENAAVLKTIVTTEMARRVAQENGVACFDTFTGFKFMAEKMGQLESAGTHEVFFSYEESYGYMMGHYVRDKDAVTASMLLCEMAAWYAAQGITLFEALDALFEKYGYHAELTVNLVMPGVDGLEDMKKLMERLRAQPPAVIGGERVLWRKDYLDGSVVETETGKRSEMELSGSNVLRYELADGTSFIVRPSGTEPKIKIYILAKGKDMPECEGRIARYAAFAQTLGHEGHGDGSCSCGQ